MEPPIGIDPPTLETAREHVLAWGMGYVPRDTARGAYGWRRDGPSDIHFKHYKIMLALSSMEAYGLKVIEVQRAGGMIDLWWGLSLTPDQWRIPPDTICEQMGLTRPMEVDRRTGLIMPTHADIDEVKVEDLDACQRFYVDWVQEFWNNTTHRALVQRLAEILPTRQTWAGTDIAAFLTEAAQALGPGAFEAPV